MQKERIKVIASVSLMAVCLGALAFRFVELPPDIDERPHVGIGQALAGQATKMAGAGGRIVVVAPDTELFDHPGPEVQLTALRRAVREAGKDIAEVYRVKLDPLRPPRMPPADLVELLRRYNSDSDVVVSLLGPGAATPELKPRVPARHARIIALCTGEMPRQINLLPLFEENLLHAAVIERAKPGFAPPAGNIPREWFDHFYQIVTAGNAAGVLEQARTGVPLP